MLIAGLGGIRPLVELLGDERKSAACREAAARTLWNLATNNDLKVSIAAAGAISPLVALMGGANASVGCKEAAAGCLRNLAVTAENAAAIVSAGGLAPLVALCRVGPGWNGGDAVAAAEAAARALWNLAYDDPSNQRAIADEGALSALLDLCRKQASPGCTEAAAGALRNLPCHCPENSAAIATERGVAALVAER